MFTREQFFHCFKTTPRLREFSLDLNAMFDVETHPIMPMFKYFDFQKNNPALIDFRNITDRVQLMVKDGSPIESVQVDKFRALSTIGHNADYVNYRQDLYDHFNKHGYLIDSLI